MVDLEECTDLVKFVRPVRIRSVSTQQCFDVRAKTVVHRLELGDGFPSADDGEVLAAMLDRVEEIGEVPSGVRSSDIRHVNQIIRVSRVIGDFVGLTSRP